VEDRDVSFKQAASPMVTSDNNRMAVFAQSVSIGNGVRLPMLGLGTWALRARPGQTVIRRALDVGYRHLDTARVYRNEEEVGRAVRDSGIAREDVFITTKLPPDRADRAQHTLCASLAALDTDYVDLWLIHWPPGGAASPETWRALVAARREGRARAIGVSNYSITQIDELIETTGEVPAVNQVKWSPSLHDPDRLAAHRERDIVLEGYSPFKSTSLRHPTLVEIANAHDVTPAQVVVRWHIQHGIVVIPKTAQLDRLRTNGDVEGFELDAAEMARIDGMSGR
jgi:2,5-diketo-D-gluconate reductase A